MVAEQGAAVDDNEGDAGIDGKGPAGVGSQELGSGLDGLAGNNTRLELVESRVGEERILLLVSLSFVKFATN